MNRKQFGMTVAVVVFVAIVLAWRFQTSAVDPQIKELQETQKKLADLPAEATREERRELFGKMRVQVEQLKPEQREEFMRTGPKVFFQQLQKRISTYFGLPPAERVAHLDAEIKRMDNMMRDMRPRGAATSGSGDKGSAGSAPPAGGQNPPSREGFQKRFLDDTSPIQRAQMTEYFQAIQARRQELGMPTWPMPAF